MTRLEHVGDLRVNDSVKLEGRWQTVTRIEHRAFIVLTLESGVEVRLTGLDRLWVRR